MKKTYLVIIFVVIGLGGLYAMLAPKIWNKNIEPSKREKTSSVTDKSAISTNEVLKKTNSCCTSEENLILGTWLSVDDTLSKWVFQNDGICYEYYADTLVDKDSYRILSASDSPLCGRDVSGGTVVNYMEWTNVDNPSDKMCFVIYGLTNEVLNVRLFGSGGFDIFKRPGSNFDPYN